MITNNKLSIFENFQIDKSLPKYNKKQKTIISNSVFTDGLVIGSAGVDGDNRMRDSSHIDYINYLNKQHIGVISKLKIYFFKKMFKDFFEINIEKNIDADEVLEFFKKIKSNISSLTYDEATINNYIEIIENAKKTGQTALIETLIQKKDVLLLESILIKSDMKTYIEEELVVDYYSKFKSYNNKQLKMSWIKNFNRIIPAEVIEKKTKADDLNVFDNYVVLHYDKNNNQTKLTEKEVEKLKDPILFGVIKDSDRLYFIGDWEDEFCDLTLDKLLTKMSTESKTLEDIQISYTETLD